jgi:hypothetical protein
MKPTCSRCPAPPRGPNQRLCRACHAAHMKAHRAQKAALAAAATARRWQWLISKSFHVNGSTGNTEAERVVLAAHTDRRVRHALLSGPLAHAHESFPLSMLVDRCEDIAGVNEGVVAHVLDGLIAAGMVAKVGALYQRAA